MSDELSPQRLNLLKEWLTRNIDRAPMLPPIQCGEILLALTELQIRRSGQESLTAFLLTILAGIEGSLAISYAVRRAVAGMGDTTPRERLWSVLKMLDKKFAQAEQVYAGLILDARRLGLGAKPGPNFPLKPQP